MLFWGGCRRQGPAVRALCSFFVQDSCSLQWQPKTKDDPSNCETPALECIQQCPHRCFSFWRILTGVRFRCVFLQLPSSLWGLVDGHSAGYDSSDTCTGGGGGARVSVLLSTVGLALTVLFIGLRLVTVCGAPPHV